MSDRRYPVMALDSGTVDIEVTGYWQRCPVCEGRGIVPQGFYRYPAGQPFTSGTAGPERCQRCNGDGTIVTPPVDTRTKDTP